MRRFIADESAKVNMRLLRQSLTVQDLMTTIAPVEPQKPPTTINYLKPRKRKAQWKRELNGRKP